MRIHFDGKATALAPNLLGDIAERLEVLNAPYEDIFEARVTLKPPGMRHDAHHTTQVELLLVGRLLCVIHEGATPHAAANAALDDIARRLHAFRMLRPRGSMTRPHRRQRQTSGATAGRRVDR